MDKKDRQLEKPFSNRNLGMAGRATRAGFTLVELLVVIAIIGVLASLLLPSLALAKEKAKVARVRAELYALGLALEMYGQDFGGRFPPVRVNCNSDLAPHWCQFPEEIAKMGYVPKSDRPGMKAFVEDLFNPGHTYKYAAPGPCLLNGQPVGNFRIWVPDDYPVCRSKKGQYYEDPKRSPVRWVIWSLGPRPKGPRANHSLAPLTAECWYRPGPEGGIIGRTATREGTQYAFP